MSWVMSVVKLVMNVVLWPGTSINCPCRNKEKRGRLVRKKKRVLMNQTGQQTRSLRHGR